MVVLTGCFLESSSSALWVFAFQTVEKTEGEGFV